MVNGKTVACIIARTTSTRLPLKFARHVSKDLRLLDYIIMRLKGVARIDEIYLCTSDEPSDDIMEDIASSLGINIYRGSSEIVIERMINVAAITNADNIIRITGDNVFSSIEYIDRQIEVLESRHLDYVRLIDVPVGATTEVMTVEALKRCYRAMDPTVSEYLMLYMFEPKNFKCGVVKPFSEDYSQYSLTVDTIEDLLRTRALFSALEVSNITPLRIRLSDLVSVLDEVPYSEMENNMLVKLPFGETMSYKDFNEDMQRRVDSSLRVECI